jgi:hypothetical protein
MTFKVWDPTRPEGHKKIWKSVNVTKFEHHGRSSQAGSGNGVDLNSFKIVHTGDPTSEEVYTIKANLGEVKIDCTFTKPASSPGWKYGDGYTNLGAQSADKRDAFVIQ